MENCDELCIKDSDYFESYNNHLIVEDHNKDNMTKSITKIIVPKNNFLYEDKAQIWISNTLSQINTYSNFESSSLIHDNKSNESKNQNTKQDISIINDEKIDSKKRKFSFDLNFNRSKLAKLKNENTKFKIFYVNNTFYYSKKSDGQLELQESTKNSNYNIETFLKDNFEMNGVAKLLMEIEKLADGRSNSMKNLNALMETRVNYSNRFPNKVNNSQKGCFTCCIPKNYNQKNSKQKYRTEFLIRDEYTGIKLYNKFQEEKSRLKGFYTAKMAFFLRNLGNMGDYKEVNINLLHFKPKSNRQSTEKIDKFFIHNLKKPKTKTLEKSIIDIFTFFCDDRFSADSGCIIKYSMIIAIEGFYELPLFLELVFKENFENCPVSIQNAVAEVLKSFKEKSQLFTNSERLENVGKMALIFSLRLHILKYLQLIHTKCIIFALYSHVMLKISDKKKFMTVNFTDSIFLYYAFITSPTNYENFKGLYFLYNDEYNLVFAIKSLISLSAEVSVNNLFHLHNIREDFILKFNRYITKILFNCRINPHEYEQTYYININNQKMILLRLDDSNPEFRNYKQMANNIFVSECMICYSRIIKYINDDC